MRFSLLAFLIFSATSVAAADGELLYGPGGVSRLQHLASDATPRLYGPAPAQVIDDLLHQAAKFRSSDYTYSSGDFRYTFGATPPPSHTDNFPHWTGMFQESGDSISTRLNVLTFAYLVDNSTESFEVARRMVLDLVAWPQWTDPDYECGYAGACLDTVHLVASLAFFYDTARCQLSIHERTAILEALVTKGLKPLNASAEIARQNEPHNILPIIAMGLAVGAAAVLDAHPQANAWLDSAVALSRYYLAAQGDDGGGLEGHGYAAYAGDYLVRVIDVAQRHGRILWSPYLDNVATYFHSALAGDGSSLGTFGDSWSGSGARLHFYLASRGDAVAQAYLVDSGLIAQQDFLTAAQADGNFAPAKPINRPWASPVAGVASLRSDRTGASTVLVFRAGPENIKIGHNQRDALTFQMWAHGAWLTGDGGYSATQAPPLFRYLEFGEGHSTLLIDRIGPVEKFGSIGKINTRNIKKRG